MKKIKDILFHLTIIVLLEIFVFNFGYWDSLRFRKQLLNVTEYALGEGIEQSGNEFIVTNKDAAFIEIKNIKKEIKNIYLDVSIKEDTLGETRYVPISIFMTDAANEEYRELPERYIVKRINESKYIRLHLNGESNKIKIRINLPENTVFQINSLQLNTVRKIYIHPLRIFLMIAIWIIWKVFRPKSIIYQLELNLKKFKQKRFATACIVTNLILIGFCAVVIQPYTTWKESTWKADSEYEVLTDALLEGHLYLDLNVSETLKKMENPYDPVIRQKMHEENQEEFYMDYAYFNGKYYCYFGVIPAILFFVPFKLLFNRHLPTWLCVSVCGLLYCVVSYIFIYLIAKKYFKRVSLGMYLLASACFVAMSSIVYLVFFGTVYSVPIITSLLFGIIGLSFWLSASNDGKISKKYLALGAMFIALIFGCRPQLAIILLFAFPIFWCEIKEKKFFSKKGMGNTLCVIIPFLIVGFMIMYYNYVRFGNVADFGANYNLTGNDMTHRGIDMGRNWLGIFEYLFQPLNIASKFPYIQVIGQNIQTDYQGMVSQEPMFGGFLWFNPIMLLCGALYREKEKLKKKKIKGFAVGALLSGILIILLTIQMSGITERYMSDFGWLFGMTTVIAMFLLEEKYGNCNKERYLKWVVGLSSVTIFLNYFNIFILGRYGSLYSTNPNVLFWVKYVLFSI